LAGEGRVRFCVRPAPYVEGAHEDHEVQDLNFPFFVRFVMRTMI
jgi:hypothetical protein